jgi:hypothetical protein
VIKRGALLALCLLVAWTPRAFAAPWICLPPAFEGGQRIHEPGAPRVFWLDLLLRQHQLCWSAVSGGADARLILLGSSAVFGFPLPVEQSFGALLNDHFRRDGIPARLFNLCSVFPYQLRDAVILHEALRYDPDIIVYPMTLSEFAHMAPVLFPPQLVEFFDRNRRALGEVVAERPAGLEDAFDHYRPMLELGTPPTLYERLREVGAFARISAAEHARFLARRLDPSLPLKPLGKTLTTRQTKYDCAVTKQKAELDFDDWKSWSILEHLAELRSRRGVEVLVVHWPIAHEPVGDCYNVRYPNDAERDFAAWMRVETQRLGLEYLDLHDFLPAEEFLDSLHVSPEGHRKIAARMAEVLDPIVQRVQQEHASR